MALNTFHAFRILLILTFFASGLGCNRSLSPGADVDHATRVTFAQLKEAVGESEFWWLGSDKDYHYFKTEKGYYRLPTDFKMPRFQKDIDLMIARQVKPGSASSSAVHVYVKDESISYLSAKARAARDARTP